MPKYLGSPDFEKDADETVAMPVMSPLPQSTDFVSFTRNQLQQPREYRRNKLTVANMMRRAEAARSATTFYTVTLAASTSESPQQHVSPAGLTKQHHEMLQEDLSLLPVPKAKRSCKIVHISRDHVERHSDIDVFRHVIRQHQHNYDPQYDELWPGQLPAFIIHTPTWDKLSQTSNEARASSLSPQEMDSSSSGSLKYEPDVYDFPETEPRTTIPAYARAVLPDGDYYFTTPVVKIVRDQFFYKRYMRLIKQKAKEMTDADHDMRRIAKETADAQRALQEYDMEPSQPSQQGENAERDYDPAIRRSEPEVLEGRPAPGLPSNYSEQGGVVTYASQVDAEEDDARRHRKRPTRSSDSTSVAPAVLDANTTPQEQANERDIENSEPGIIPIHPSWENAEHIKSISREHLLINYNFDRRGWDLHVLSKLGCFHNGRLLPQDACEPLDHGDVIQIKSIPMTFQLPQQDSQSSPMLSQGTFNDTEMEEGENMVDDAQTSPAAERLSNAFSVPDEEDEEEDIDQNTPLEEPSKKNAPKTKRIKLSAKKESPVATKKPATTKPAKDAATAADTAESKDKKPTPPVNIQPDSVFANLAPDQVPEKRKGAGRPPKNGVASKANELAVKKKQKDYRSRGLEPPTVNELLAMVREEQKQKNDARKAATRGEEAPPPSASANFANGTTNGENVVQSIEGDNGTAGSGDPSREPCEDRQISGPGRLKKTSPKQNVAAANSRVSASPSPIPPESSFTPEQLQRPNLNHAQMIDIILREHPVGRADFPDLYLRIKKRWPHYAYKVGSDGWTSSVRHNVKDNPRFKEDGKSGKGKMWTVDWDYPLENRRSNGSRPRRNQQQQRGSGSVNGLSAYPAQPPYSQSGTANAGYMTQAGMQQQHGQYSSPYAPAQMGLYGGPVQPMGQQLPHQTGLPNGVSTQHRTSTSQTPNYQPPQSSNGQSQPTTQNQQTALQPIINEITPYLLNYLSRCAPNSEEYARRNQLFERVMDVLLAQFHSGLDDGGQNQMTDEERGMFLDLQPVFARYPHLRDPLMVQPQPQRQAVNTGPGNVATTVTAVTERMVSDQADISGDVDENESVMSRSLPVANGHSNSREMLAEPQQQVAKEAGVQSSNSVMDAQQSQAKPQASVARQDHTASTAEQQQEQQQQQQLAGTKRPAEEDDHDFSREQRYRPV